MQIFIDEAFFESLRIKKDQFILHIADCPLKKVSVLFPNQSAELNELLVFELVAVHNNYCALYSSV